ncbi:hypothetical protein HJFPF1_08067 [Paramyrothecium foliicola]|nr:hypothetical protein HJFPF1_08067 [Paramyrothecium foliicola]
MDREPTIDILAAGAPETVKRTPNKPNGSSPASQCFPAIEIPDVTAHHEQVTCVVDREYTIRTMTQALLSLGLELPPVLNVKVTASYTGMMPMGRFVEGTCGLNCDNFPVTSGSTNVSWVLRKSRSEGAEEKVYSLVGS